MLALLIFLVGVFGSALASSAARAIDVPPPPSTHVSDSVGLLSLATRLSLHSRLAAYEASSGHQIVVWIGDTSGSMPIETFAVEAFAAWKLGRSGQDDGLALFVFAADRKIRIEVGYGLEDRVTDLEAAKVIREVVTPRMQAGNSDAAIVGAVEALVDIIEGRPGALMGANDGEAQSGLESAPVELGPVEIGLILVLGLGFVVLLFTHPRLALWLLWVVVSSSGGGRRGGGGGFGGGGGRSGGGGATGGW